MFSACMTTVLCYFKHLAPQVYGLLYSAVSTLECIAAKVKWLQWNGKEWKEVMLAYWWGILSC